MNHLGMIIAIETFAIVLILSAVLLTVNWRRKNRLTTEIKQLLDEVDKTRASRKQWLEEFLSSKHQVAATEVAELSQHFISAEKVFLQHFVKQQLEHSSPVSVYGQARELLDQYLKLMPIPSPQVLPKTIKTEPVALAPIPEPSPTTSEPDDEFQEITDTKLTIATEEPDRGDAFAESGDSSPNSKPEDEFLEVAETKLTAEADEPDWGDAFAESGDTLAENVPVDKPVKVADTKTTTVTDEPDWGDAFAESGDALADNEPLATLAAKKTPELADSADTDATDESDWDMAFAEADQTPI